LWPPPSRSASPLGSGPASMCAGLAQGLVMKGNVPHLAETGVTLPSSACIRHRQFSLRSLLDHLGQSAARRLVPAPRTPHPEAALTATTPWRAPWPPFSSAHRSNRDPGVAERCAPRETGQQSAPAWCRQQPGLDLARLPTTG